MDKNNKDTKSGFLDLDKMLDEVSNELDEIGSELDDYGDEKDKSDKTVEAGKGKDRTSVTPGASRKDAVQGAKTTRGTHNKQSGPAITNKQKKVYGIFALAVIAIIALAVVIEHFTPSKEHMALSEYFPKVTQDEMLVIMQDKLSKEQGIYMDGKPYISYELLTEKINKRFYFDSIENQLLYTTATEEISAAVDSKEYYTNKSKSTVDYNIVHLNGDKVYVALDYVKQYTALDYQFFEDPNRVVIKYKFNTPIHLRTAKKEAAVRYEPNIKSPILYDLQPKEEILCFDGKDEGTKGFIKVMTESGITGYAKVNRLNDSVETEYTTDFVPQEYSHISKDFEINMAFHQVTNRDANDNLINMLEKTKGVNVVAPTWFTLAESDGSIASLASENYVERAHKAGVEVWAVVKDFDTEVDPAPLLKATTSRQKLVKELTATAIQYDLDGINVDFEKVREEDVEAYLEFIRELSIKCRGNGLVLSIDNYVPSDYTNYFDREEQAAVADYVVTMAYDEHTSGDEEAGSVSSLSFVKQALEDLEGQIPATQSIIAIPFYTRLWKEEDGDNGGVSVSSEAYGMENAAKVLESNEVKTVWLKDMGQYYGEYDADGATYRMWLEDVTSLEEKLKEIKAKKVAGIAEWRLGLETEEAWSVIQKYFNN
ncbi:MAG: glycosyl hydrolase family 18 [Lachnospiraceae bacterium]|nr:glycosyl hydrolase family 18 [Lachnospiraceae bacterium]